MGVGAGAVVAVAVAATAVAMAAAAAALDGGRAAVPTGNGLSRPVKEAAESMQAESMAAEGNGIGGGAVGGGGAGGGGVGGRAGGGTSGGAGDGAEGGALVKTLSAELPGSIVVEPTLRWHFHFHVGLLQATHLSRPATPNALHVDFCRAITSLRSLSHLLQAGGTQSQSASHRKRLPCIASKCAWQASVCSEQRIATHAERFCVRGVSSNAHHRARQTQHDAKAAHVAMGARLSETGE